MRASKRAELFARLGRRIAAGDLRSILILIFLVGFIFVVASNLQGDFPLFYQSCQLFLKRLNPYLLVGHVENKEWGFAYPPAALFLTLIPSLFPFGFALLIWLFISLLMWAVIVYLWANLLWGENPSLDAFSRLAAICLIAPAIWCFGLHQLTIASLFFATGALWLLFRKDHPFTAGLLAGISLVKPHLTIPLLLFLCCRIHSRRKWFIAGVLTTLMLSISPFFLGYRPLSDLRDLWSSLERHRTENYARDDQSLVANLHGILLGPSSGVQIADKSDAQPATYKVSPSTLGTFNLYKNLSFALCLLAWLCLGKWAPPAQVIPLSALALAAAVAFGPYSHISDGTMLIPLILLATRHVLRSIPLHNFWIAASAVNMTVAIVLPFDLSFNRVHWDRAGWMTVLYLGLAAGLLLWGRTGLGKSSSTVTFP